MNAYYFVRRRRFNWKKSGGSHCKIERAAFMQTLPTLFSHKPRHGKFAWCDVITGRLVRRRRRDAPDARTLCRLRNIGRGLLRCMALCILIRKKRTPTKNSRNKVAFISARGIFPSFENNSLLKHWISFGQLKHARYKYFCDELLRHSLYTILFMY